jgi:hypothetical protein
VTGVQTCALPILLSVTQKLYTAITVIIIMLTN